MALMGASFCRQQRQGGQPNGNVDGSSENQGEAPATEGEAPREPEEAAV